MYPEPTDNDVMRAEFTIEELLGDDPNTDPSAAVPMDVDSPTDAAYGVDCSNLNAATLEKFRKEAARAFFNEYGLISHQITSYNEFVERGIQDLFDNLGEVTVEPGYDPSKKSGGEWRRATITYDKIRIEKPSFWSGKDDLPEESLKLLSRHARLQNMTYSSLIKVESRVQVFTQELSDKTKTRNAPFVYKNVHSDETKEISVGRIPVMVKSKLCWLSNGDKSDSLFDYGGYFVIKGAEKGQSFFTGAKEDIKSEYLTWANGFCE